MYTVIYKQNGTGPCIQLLSIVFTVKLVHVWLFTSTIELVHLYSYSLLYLQIKQNWCIYMVIYGEWNWCMYTVILYCIYKYNRTGLCIVIYRYNRSVTCIIRHTYTYLDIQLELVQQSTSSYCFLYIQCSWSQYNEIHCDINASTCNVLKYKKVEIFIQFQLQMCLSLSTQIKKAFHNCNCKTYVLEPEHRNQKGRQIKFRLSKVTFAVTFAGIVTF